MTAIEPAQAADRLDLTPDPRILEVLGQIPYPPWRCLAELIDNSFDELMLDPDRAQKRGSVHIAVPRSSSGQADAEVVVADNGRGMSRATLERSLRAGYTGKARYGSLGLFGMGFNIATARLGNRTIVRTTRKGDEHWSVTEIDFREMQRRDSFHVPLRYEAKDDPSEHGTEIIVRDLNPEMLGTLQRPSTIAVVKKRLGRVYSYLLREESPIPQAADGLLAGRGIALYINGKRVEPWLPCAWSAARTVSYRGAEISAVQVVDHRLADAYACMRCGHWQRRHNADQCPECGSEELELRPRRVHGWLGVQRYLADSEYGVDFLRNGRRILIDDKTLFTWEDFDTGEADLEYPLEVPNGQGRLIGEIHLDHVPVDYQKTDFKRETPEWREAVVHLRGEGPMREKKARQRGYPENDSLMGRLFKAFQRNDPGLRCLIPGDGHHALHEAAREWGKLFHSGIPDYQTDEQWYEAAVRNDELKAGQRTGGRHDPPGRGSGRDGLGGRTGLTPTPLPGPRIAEPPGGTRPRPPVGETEDERFTHYAKDAKEFYDLAGEVSVAGLGKRKVRVFDTSARLQNVTGTQEVPVVSRAGTGMNLEVFVNGDHVVFREFGRDPRDYAIIEIAQALRAIASSNLPLLAVAAEVTCQLPDQRMTPSALRDRAEAVLRRVRDLIGPIVAARTEEMWTVLPNVGKTAAERHAAQADPTLDWRAATRDGRFAAHLDCEAIAVLLRHDPSAFMDGAVFITGWAAWSDPQVRERHVAQVIRLLQSVGEFLADPGDRNRPDLAMYRLSIDMLDQAVSRPE